MVVLQLAGRGKERDEKELGFLSGRKLRHKYIKKMNQQAQSLSRARISCNSA